MKLVLYKKDILNKNEIESGENDIMKDFISNYIIDLIYQMVEDYCDQKDMSKRLKIVSEDLKIDAKQFILNAIDRIDISQTYNAFILKFTNVKYDDDPLSDDAIMRILMFGNLSNKNFRITVIEDVFNYIQSNIHQLFLDWLGGED